MHDPWRQLAGNRKFMPATQMTPSQPDKACRGPDLPGGHASNCRYPHQTTTLYRVVTTAELENLSLGLSDMQADQ